MNKTILMLGLAAGLLSACSNKSVEGGYTINGTADGTADGDTIFYARMAGYYNYMPIDTAIVTDGKFFFTGKQEGADLRYIVAIHNGENVGEAEVVVENTNYEVTIYGREKKADIKGGQAQQLWDKMVAFLTDVPEEVSENYIKLNDQSASDEERAAAQEALMEFSRNQTESVKKFVVDNAPSAFSDMVLGYYLEGFEQFNIDVDSVVGTLAKAGFPQASRIVEEREAQQKTAEGKPYIDFEATKTDGDKLKISSVVESNKLTLIDFWASWCGPCRAEMPFVIDAYEKFHGKGFEIVGVSLDNSKDAWLGAIDQLKMNWLNVSDLAGWDCEYAALYNVRAIPSNFLVNKDGIIVGKNLRGDDLAAKIAEELAK
ncbi:MAG: AhpC/TSA family protein [Bacteroidales bacterium]|nr:AhpC/TSA family protein [Bacteroidales bacterium]